MKYSRLLPALACLGGITLPIQAADYYLQANSPAGSGWNTLSTWFDQPSGGGNNPVAMAGNDFFINGWALRTIPANFGGASLTNDVAGGGVTVQDSGRTLGTFNVTAQGRIALNNAASVYALNITNLNLSSTLNLRAPSSGMMTINVTDLSGDGDLIVGGGAGGASPGVNSVLALSVIDASGFTGRLSPTIGTLTFDNAADYSLAAFTLDGNNSFSVNLANDVTFGSVVGTNFANDFSSLATGQYSASELNSLVGVDIFSGTGKLTVVPEPSVSSLLVGIGLLCVGLRSRWTRGNKGTR